MKSADEIKKFFKNAAIGTDPAMDETVLNKVLIAYEKATNTKSAVMQSKIRRIIMKSPITKLAAAAVIIVAGLVGITQLGGSATSVAWGEVAKNVGEVHAFVSRERETKLDAVGNETSESYKMQYFSSKYGFRLDSYRDGEVAIQTYLLPVEKAIVSVVHPMKKYDRRQLPESEIKLMEQFGVRELVKMYLSTEYKELGRDTIEGVEVEGIEVNDPKVVGSNVPIDGLVARLWVDVETRLPVLLEGEVTGNGGALHTKTVIDKFQWNVELDASDFEPNIPADYESMQ